MLKWKLGATQLLVSKYPKLASIPWGYCVTCLLPKEPTFGAQMAGCSLQMQASGALRRHSDLHEAGSMQPMEVTGAFLFTVSVLLESLEVRNLSQNIGE